MSEVQSRSKMATVVMPVHNVESTVEQQLSALEAQDYDGSWELVVVNDGSTDGTAERVEAWADRIPGLRLLSTERRGVAHARNVGTRAASSNLIAYCDGDDVVGASWLSGLVDQLGVHDIAAGTRDLTKLNPPHLYEWRQSEGAAVPRFAGYLFEVSGGNMGVRREAFDLVGGFDEKMLTGQDIDFAWRLQLAGATVGHAPGSVVHYRFRRGWAYFARYMKYGGAQTDHYVRFRSKGMERHPWSGLGRLALAAVSSPLVLYRPLRYRWLTSAGISVGRLLGSIRHRTIYL